jgi:thioesterase domain-containing protein
MVPVTFVRLDRMPLALNEKLDREALPHPEESTNQDSFRPPVGAAESAICRIFREMTGAPQVGRDDDFFQIGGHSLAAVLCVHHLRREFNREVTLRQLFGAPTARALAESFSKGGVNKTVQSGPSNPAYPTIFLLPGMGGDEPRLVRFRMEWEGLARIVLLEYPDWTQLLDRNESMEILVRHFLRRIEEELPDGPVWLLGYSLGGNCAHAVALHLAGIGREVAFVGLLDAEAMPGLSDILSAQLQDGVTPLQEVLRFLQDIVRVVRAIPQQALTRVVALTIVRRLTSPWARSALSVAARYRRTRLPVRFNYHLHAYLNEARRVDAVRLWHRNLTQAPVPLFIPAFLFRSEERLPGEAADLGWERHFPQLEILNFAGTHETIFEPPHLKTLCDRTYSVIDTLYGAALTSTTLPS